jgi:BirA family transcriptional regulator, biotin operon repressor / biotin---[acetyl-CoA-carboxylase] ligase
VVDPPRTIELERCDSTQDELRVLARAGAPAFTVVRADVQDAGRGRRGRSWHTRPGTALLASVLLRPRRPASELAGLAIVGGVAAARVAQGLGVDARLRWPNDVVIGGRKLAGVLAELIDGPAIVLGVGMNADAGIEDLPETDGLPPTSLRIEGARPATLSELAALLVGELRPLCERFDGGGFAAVREDAEGLDALRGLELELALTGGETARGIACGFADDGALVLDTPAGRVEHRAGIVTRVHGGSLRQSPA